MPKKTPGINGGSMSDISFLLLTFFLLTSSINSDSGIARRLPPPLPPNAEKPEIRERNVMMVMVNFQDQLRVRGENMDISQLRGAVKDFLGNPFNESSKSEHEEVMVEGLGMVRKSKGVISLQSDNNTSYEMYIKVQNELTAGVNELRDALSLEKYGVRFSALKDDFRKEAIQKAILMPISEAEPKDYGGNK